MSNRVKRHDNIISSEDRLKISKRYKRITKAINREFWKLDNDTANSFHMDVEQQLIQVIYMFW